MSYRSVLQGVEQLPGKNNTGSNVLQGALKRQEYQPGKNFNGRNIPQERTIIQEHLTKAQCRDRNISGERTSPQDHGTGMHCNNVGHASYCVHKLTPAVTSYRSCCSDRASARKVTRFIQAGILINKCRNRYKKRIFG